jgi:hypothetical protein
MVNGAQHGAAIVANELERLGVPDAVQRETVHR